jgi:hypothetical protein
MVLQSLQNVLIRLFAVRFVDGLDGRLPGRRICECAGDRKI